MRYCKCCHLAYRAPLKQCPFCGNILEQTEGSVDTYHYPEYVKKKHILAASQKIMTFLSLTGIVICILIDLLTGSPVALTWAGYPVASIVLLLLLFLLLTSHRPVRQKLTESAFFGILFVMVVGSLGKDSSWIYEFIYPLGVLAVNICLSFNYIVFHRKELYDAAIYLLIVSLLGLIPAIFLLCNSMTYTWPSIACIVFSLLIITGLFFFSTKQTKEELKRRLHL